MHPNWFLALPVSGADLRQALPPAPPGVRLFVEADLHVTIAFLGPVDEGAALAAWEGLVWPLGPTEITLGDVVPLGPPDRYSALSALLVQGRWEVEGAIGTARKPVCAIARVTEDPRPPKAHVTLARPKRRASEEERAGGLGWASALRLAKTPLSLDRVALYTWAADRKETLFTIVRERRL